MVKKLTLALCCATLLIASCKDKNKFTTLKSGLQYNIIKEGSGKTNPKIGDILSLNISTKIGDSTAFDSRKMNAGKPIEVPITAPANVGDLMEAFVLLHEGDSAVFKIPCDTLFKNPAQKPPFVKAGDLVTFYVNVVKIKSEADVKAETAKQVAAEDGAIQEYLKKNNIANAQKTASGMYYTITTPGAGANAQAGQQVTMSYTGTLLDGTKFDSNEDPQFKHVQPFQFVLGNHQVIPGWDEGIALLNKGAVAKLIIPSPMAYGSQARPGLPANSVLVFNVKVNDIKAAPAMGQGHLQTK